MTGINEENVKKLLLDEDWTGGGWKCTCLKNKGLCYNCRMGITVKLLAEDYLNKRE